MKPEIIELLKKIHKGLHVGEKNSMYGKKGYLSSNFGRKMPKSFCENISKRQLGENNPFAKLNWSKVREIRTEHKNKTITYFAKKFSVSRKCISKVINNHTWKENNGKETN
jgi:hypothetical protein